MKIVNSEIVKLFDVFKKLLGTTDVVPRWEFAKRHIVLEDAMRPINKAREIPESMNAYIQEENKVLSKYGDQVVDDGRVGYKIRDFEAANKELKTLQDANKELLDAERDRLRGIDEMMKIYVDIDISPIRNEWCGDLIDGNDVKVLIKNGLIEE